jgi:putative membrane protein
LLQSTRAIGAPSFLFWNLLDEGAFAAVARKRSNPHGSPFIGRTSVYHGGSAFAQSSKMGTMGDEEKKHILETLQVGTMSLEASRIAVNRAKEPMVKQFANFEVAEQETIGEILKPLAVAAHRRTDAGRLDEETGFIGREFRPRLCRGGIEGHNRLLQIQEAYIMGGKD